MSKNSFQSKQPLIATASITTFVFLGMFWIASHQPISDQASKAREPAESITTQEILQKIQLLKGQINDPEIYNIKTCNNYLNNEYKLVFELKPESFDFKSIEVSAKQILDAVFSLRLELRNRYAELTRQQNFPESCAFSHRKAFRAMRVFEDYLGEASLGFPYNFYLDNKEEILKGTKEEIVVPAFQSAETNILWNPKYRPADKKYIPQSGDFILSRGNASTSAAISRITDEDANFSHLSVVYKNPVTNRVETVEAHIEIGSRIFDFENEYVADKKIRAAVFRLRDPKKTDAENDQIAFQAAEAIRNHVENYRKKNGKNICYNFSMKMDIEKCLFCSQIASYGMKLIDPQFNMPMFQSQMNPKNTSFLDVMGVLARQTFAPADIELDSRFELVAEWRDYNRLHHAHHLDAILTAMFRWMDERNYELTPSFFQELQGNFGYVIRRIPLLDSISGIDEKFPLNMPSKTIKGVQSLNSVTNALKAYLEDQELMADGIRRLSPKQMLDLLENFREVEYNDWVTDLKNPLVDGQVNPQYRFHYYFSPKN